MDAICIDQSNLLEKIHQVKLMGLIYSRASTVHVWLGIATPPVEESAVSGLPRPSAYEYTKQFEADMQHDLAEAGKNLMTFGLSLNKHIIFYITQNTYWKRAWVVQEICLAQKLIFWLHTVPVDETIMQNIRRDYFSAILEDDDFDQYRDTNFKKPARTSLVTTLHQFQNKQCADPRDRVFSLLSLCSTGVLPIPVDYKIELDQLAYYVLHSHPGPTGLCSAMSVARQLELLSKTDKYKEPVNIRGDITPWIEVDMSEIDLEQFLLDPHYLKSVGLCESFKPIFRAVITGCLGKLWTADEAGYRLREDSGKAHTIRIALRALGKADDFRSSIVLCRTAFSVMTDAAEAMIRLGRGHDGSDIQDLVTLGWTPRHLEGPNSQGKKRKRSQ
jgi:hypothetical protein